MFWQHLPLLVVLLWCLVTGRVAVDSSNSGSSNYDEEEDMDFAKPSKSSKLDSMELLQQQQPHAAISQHAPPQLYIEQDFTIFYTKSINLTSVLSKPIRLPCMVERGRKFIWMKADRNEILTIDNMLITNDRRFSIEHSHECYDKPVSSGAGGDLLVNKKMKSKGKTHVASGIQSRHANADHVSVDGGISVESVGCWVYLCIENINMDDEGLYVCQIDTMSSTKISLNVLGII
jgi:hypothetical protein